MKCLRYALSLTVAMSTYALAGSAFADGYEGSIKDAPVPAPIRYDWSGLSVGVGIGAGRMDTEVDAKAWRKDLVDKRECYKQYNKKAKKKGIYADEKCFDKYAPDKFDHLKSSGSSDDWNLFGTLQIGYDRLLGDRFLIGAFADIDFYKDADLSFSKNDGPHDSLTGSVQRDNIWTVGGRLGFLATPRLLVYGLAGYSRLHLDGQLNAQFNDPYHQGNPTNLSLNVDDWVRGYTVGAGLEAKLEKQLSLKLEYRYSAFDGAKAKIEGEDSDS